MRVSVRNAAVAAGLIAAVYLAAAFSIRRVPDWLLGPLGGPSGIEREGGCSCATGHPMVSMPPGWNAASRATA